MREIKFRAWFNDKWDFRYDQKMEIFSLKELCDTGSDDYDDFIYMQYTGLKDKNGVEIYEGDILKPNGLVVWDNDNSIFHCIFNDGLDRKFKEFTRLEIIGNIHENEEPLDS